MTDVETSMDNFPSYQVVMESEGMRAAVFTVQKQNEYLGIATHASRIISIACLAP